MQTQIWAPQSIELITIIERAKPLPLNIFSNCLFPAQFPQAAQAQNESTCDCVIFKMAVIMKDLYENSGNRFEKINTGINFQ